MPDWLTHIVIALIFAEIINTEKKSLVILGRFHTPFMTFLVTLLVAPLFRYHRAKTLILLNVGMLSHYLSDIMLRHYVGGIRMLWPLSEQQYILNWFWSDQAIYLLAISLAAYFLIRWSKTSHFINTKHKV